MSTTTQTIQENIASTVWPSNGVPEPVKGVLSLLLQLLDDKSDNAGPRLADEVFTKDGVMGAAHKAARGYDGINDLTLSTSIGNHMLLFNRASFC